MIYIPTRATGKYLSFPDANQYDVTGSFSLCFWCNTTAAAGGTFPIAIGKGVGLNNTSSYFTFMYQGQNALSFGYQTTSNAQYLLTSTLPITIGWKNAICVRDATANTMTIYINAVVAGSRSTPAGANPAITTTPVTIGGGSLDSVNRCWQGNLMDCRIYSRALSTSEVSAIYAAKCVDNIFDDTLILRACIADDCVGAGDMAGKKVYDHSAYRNHGTCTGAISAVADQYPPFRVAA